MLPRQDGKSGAASPCKHDSISDKLPSELLSTGTLTAAATAAAAVSLVLHVAVFAKSSSQASASHCFLTTEQKADARQLCLEEAWAACMPMAEQQTDQPDLLHVLLPTHDSLVAAEPLLHQATAEGRT